MTAATTFDRPAAEAAVAAALAALGVTATFAPPSRHVGVVAFARPPRDVSARLDWAAFGRDIEGRTGLVPLCVEDCDWPSCPVNGGRLTLVAFDVADADEDWRYEYHNKLPWRPHRAA